MNRKTSKRQNGTTHAIRVFPPELGKNRQITEEQAKSTYRCDDKNRVV